MMTMISQLFQAVSTDWFVIGQKRSKKPRPVHSPHALAGASIGQPVRLLAVRGEHKVVHRLAELGLTPGVTLTVVQAAGGPLLVAVRGARVAIGRELAEQIEVAPLR